MTRLIALVALLFASPAAGLEPLPPEVDAAFQAGVHAVIGCESCHWEDPDRIPRAQVATVCGDCHPGPHEDFLTSVHWDGGQAHAVCVDCHGIHGILPVAEPGSRAHRSIVCGDCHTGAMQALNAGPHRAAFDAAGLAVCASCHGNHAVQAPTVAIVEPACLECHAEDTAAFAFGQRVESQFDGIRESIARTRGLVHQAESEGLYMRRASETLEDGTRRFTQARLTWHGLDATAIDEHVVSTEKTVRRAADEVRARADAQATRESWLMAAWVAIAAAVIALHLKRKSIEAGTD